MGGYYFFVGSNLEKYGTFWKKQPFFRADMAGLGKYSMGGYGRLGVFRVHGRLYSLPHPLTYSQYYLYK